MDGLLSPSCACKIVESPTNHMNHISSLEYESIPRQLNAFEGVEYLIISNSKVLDDINEHFELNIDSKIIQNYECGKAIPEFNIMIKLEKILGVKLNKKKTQK